MKNKIFMSVAAILLLGCTKTQIDQELTKEILVPYANGAVANLIDEIATLKVSYKVNVAGLDGRIWDSYGMKFPNSKALVELCPVNLTKDDVEKITETTGILFKRKSISYDLINIKKKKLFNICIVENFKKQKISGDDLGYFIGDDRIREKVSDPSLKQEIAKANEDAVITYGEILSIYKQLDKTYEKNRENELKSMIDGP